MHRYLYSYRFNTYNNEQQFYELEPLPSSDITKAVLFAGQQGVPGGHRTSFLYLETSKPISDSNRYINLSLIGQMVQLETGLPTEEMIIAIELKDFKSFDEVLSEYGSDTYYEPGVSYGGMVNTPNGIANVAALCHFLNLVNDEERTKFQNALQSFIWAQELERFNPHIRYTLYMTLYLSSINQLADKPSPIHQSKLVCPDCGEALNMRHSTSHIVEMEKLVRRLMTGKGVDDGVKRLKYLYHELRSDSLHDGLLSGSERQGGFLADDNPEHIKLVEDMANVQVLNRKLLGLYLQDKATN